MVQFWISGSTHNSAGFPALAMGFRKCLIYSPRMAVSNIESLANSNVLIVSVLDFRTNETYGFISYMVRLCDSWTCLKKQLQDISISHVMAMMTLDYIIIFAVELALKNG